MKTIILAVTEYSKISQSVSYYIGLLISLFIFCYLIYSLVKPEKF
jgi:K+-transporting ATPase KdpF subunit